MGSIFSNSINIKNNDTSGIQSDMIFWSKKLQKAMGLSYDNVLDIGDENSQFNVGDYIVTARNFCFGKSGWFTLLYAVPASMGHNIGWSNVEIGTYDSTQWKYNPKGTCTTILPNEAEQENILKSIKEYREMFE